MHKKLPQRDPSAAYVRKAKATRRVGMGAQCACGESRPEALIAQSNPTICAACDRKKKGKATMDNHHPAGKANNPSTVPIHVNDHRAELSSSQLDWPKATRENPEGSPLLAAAAGIRGFKDTVLYLIEKLLVWAADMMERLDTYLQKQLGQKWWLRTEMEQFAPKR